MRAAKYFPGLARTARFDSEARSALKTLDLLKSTNKLFAEVQAEQVRIVQKWGPDAQTHPSVDLTDGWTALDEAYLLHGVISEDAAKEVCETTAAEGSITWADILTEEVAEAYGAKTEELRRGELIQCMAVIADWIADIDEKIAGPDDEAPTAEES